MGMGSWRVALWLGRVYADGACRIEEYQGREEEGCCYEYGESGEIYVVRY